MDGDRKVQIIKTVAHPLDIEYLEETAVSDFRAFSVVGSLHIARVQTPTTIDAMLDTLDALQTCLRERKVMVVKDVR